MKNSSIILLFAIIAVISTISISAAPVGMSFIPTVNVRGDLINDLTNLMVNSNGNGANGLSVALQHQALKAQDDINELYALDTATLTDAELVEYVEAMAKLNLALTNASTACKQLGFTDSAATIDSSFGGLIAYVQFSADSNSRVCQQLKEPVSFAPEGGTIWGTVWLKC